MFFNTPKRRFIFVLLFLLISFIINLFIFYPVFISDNIIISFAVHPFDICNKYPNGWILIKNLYVLSLFVSNLIIANVIYSFLFKKSPVVSSKINNEYSFTPDNNLNLKIGLALDDSPVFLPLKGLFQNILITGTIGSGKTF